MFVFILSMFDDQHNCHFVVCKCMNNTIEKDLEYGILHMYHCIYFSFAQKKNN